MECMFRIQATFIAEADKAQAKKTGEIENGDENQIA